MIIICYITTVASANNQNSDVTRGWQKDEKAAIANKTKGNNTTGVAIEKNQFSRDLGPFICVPHFLFHTITDRTYESTDLFKIRTSNICKVKFVKWAMDEYGHKVKLCKNWCLMHFCSFPFTLLFTWGKPTWSEQYNLISVKSHIQTLHVSGHVLHKDLHEVTKACNPNTWTWRTRPLSDFHFWPFLS